METFGKILFGIITVISIYCSFLILKDFISGIKSFFFWVRRTFDNVKKYIKPSLEYAFAALVFLGFFKLIILIRESVVLSGIIWIVVIGFWLIVVIIAYLFGINKIINQYKGLESEERETFKVKGDIRHTIFAMFFITLVWGFCALQLWWAIGDILSVM